MEGRKGRNRDKKGKGERAKIPGLLGQLDAEAIILTSQ